MLRRNQKNRLRARKTEREMLQCASSQALAGDADADLVKEISQSNPSFAKECMLKKSITFKDPTNTEFSTSV